MMVSRGHKVYLYSGDRNEAACTEHIPVVRPEDRRAWFGSEDWPVRETFGHWSADSPCWAGMNAAAIPEIRARIEPRDFVGLIAGECQRPLWEAFPQALSVEWGIGYRGVCAPYRVYESHAWRHFLAGLQDNDEIRYFDAVIPNAYDPEDLKFSATPGEYLLYLARPTVRKGQDIIRDLVARSPLPVHTAGQGGPWLDGATHHGVVLGREKAELLAGAAALLSPTTYLEPFGGVTIEAMLSGTPVITTDWGVYTETVQHGVNGFRCMMLADFVDAARRVQGLDRTAVRESVWRYRTAEVRHQYTAYFRRLQSLYDAGWYTGA
jgi:glycosyltransferase involved in cell wall biosynthesis